MNWKDTSKHWSKTNQRNIVLSKIKHTLWKKGEHTSPKTEFKKGLTPWNKGKKGVMPVPWNKGKKCFQTSKKAKENKHGNYFKEGEKPVSHKKGCKCFRCTGITWNKGKRGVYITSEETKRKMSLGKKGRKPKNFDDLMKKLHSKEPTNIEIKVYKELKKRGFLFEKQKIINGKFIVDAYIPKLNLVIEADGDYWHSLLKAKERDKRKNDYLQEHGFNLLRLTETEINNDLFKEKLPCHELAIQL